MPDQGRNVAQVLGLAAAILAVGFGYIAVTKKWHLLCPVTYTRMFSSPASSSSSSASSSPSSSAATAGDEVADLPKFTTAELKKYKGETDPTKVYVSVKGVVYRVTFQNYGPGENYHCFAGADVSRNLGKGDVSDSEIDADWRGLSAEQLAMLDQWVEGTFKKKYKVVGTLVQDNEFLERGRQFDDKAKK